MNKKKAKNFSTLYFPHQKKAKQQVILEERSEQRHHGKIKFVNFEKNYGFIVKEGAQQDIFFHLKDLESEDVDREVLENKESKFSFSEVKYIGK